VSNYQNGQPKPNGIYDGETGGYTGEQDQPLGIYDGETGGYTGELDRPVEPITRVDQIARTPSTTRENSLSHLQTKRSISVFDTRQRGLQKKGSSKTGGLGLDILPLPCKVIGSDTDHAVWEFTDENVLASGFFSAKSGKRSEDAEPLFISLSESQVQRLLIGAFDGMGGAGAAIVNSSANSYSEAYIASRLLRARLLDLGTEGIADALITRKQRAISAPVFLNSMKDFLVEAMEQLEIGASGTSRIRGTLTKTLPSTLACAEILVRKNNQGHLQTKIYSMWAGDSRVWVMTPQSGLQQITRDDVDLVDPLEQLRQDPPMNNVVSASVDFLIREHHVELSGPCLVIAATDGVCGYVRSPGEVELIVLRALKTAHFEKKPFSETLFDSFTQLANDDASCVITSIGFEDLSSVNKAFENRLRLVEDRYSKLQVQNDDIDLSVKIDEIWSQEKTDYCALLPGGGL
jgi:serine/threonine protein phosphatase PrpC